MANKENDKTLTLNQLKRQEISLMWREYRGARAALDQGFAALEAGSSSTDVPECDSASCVGMRPVNVNGEISYVCKLNGNWVFCKP